MTPSELQDFYDYTISEVAQVLGVSINTVNRDQKSALEKIAKILADRGITSNILEK